MDSRISKLLSIDEAKHGCVRNPLDDPREIGCYSVDARKRQHYDRSHMKYYIRRDDRNLHMDLNVGYGKDVKKVYDRVQVMDDLLRWIVNSRFEPLHEYATHFVCTRGVIEAFLETPFLDGGLLPVVASRLDDVIYMHTVETYDRAELELEASEYEKRCCAYGFKFEQYMTADRPDGIPDVTSTTHQLENFSVVIKNRIGSYNLLMEGEIDAIDPSSPHPGSGDPSCYVELKTTKLIPNFKSTDLFQRSKSLGWWAQSVCTGIEKIICGMRDKQGIVREIETVNTSDLPFLCANKWSQRICFNYCYNVLHYLRKRITVNDPRNKSFKWWRQSVCSGVEKIICGFRDEEGIVRDIKVFNTSDLASSRENKWSPRVCMNFCHNVLHYLKKRMTVNDPRIVYRCEYTGGSTVSVTREENPTGPFNLIPDWYEAELRKC